MARNPRLDDSEGMLKHFLNPPNWFTAASLFCGLYSIILATGIEGDPNYYRSALMILFAGVFDTLDGGVARLTNTGSEFGIQLDSLVDVVSFGLAPAVLLYAWGIHDLGALGLVGAFVFLVCGVFRLARFNTKADGTKHDFSEGLTITCAGGTVAAAVMAHAASGRTDVEHPVNVLLLALALAFFMVSRIPFRTWKSLRLSRQSFVLLSLLIGTILVTAVKVNLSSIFITVAAVYLTVAMLEMLAGRVRRPRVQAAYVATKVELDEDEPD